MSTSSPTAPSAERTFRIGPRSTTLEELRESIKNPKHEISEDAMNVLNRLLDTWDPDEAKHWITMTWQPAIINGLVSAGFSAAFRDQERDPEWQSLSGLLAAATECLETTGRQHEPHLFAVRYVSEKGDLNERVLLVITASEQGGLHIDECSWGEYIENNAVVCVPFEIIE